MLALSAIGAAPEGAERSRWGAHAARTMIVRDNWGIPHITGRTDADAVFGMMYAQAEDDFARIEANYLAALGRSAEAEGEGAIWADLRQRLYVDEAALKADFARSPLWLQRLMIAWADGLNYYLASNPRVRPKVLTRFEPWMALSFSEGSIGGNIERISLSALRGFYDAPTPPTPEERGIVPVEPGGSNGIAIAPPMTEAGRALLLINPHTTFYFRSEAKVTSGEGLEVYGAATWGQFFVYQGFNRTAGWMHTTSGADNVDEFAETVVRRGDRLAYLYGRELRPLTAKRVTLRYRRADGSLGERSFTTYRSHHGPIVKAQDGKWIATALMWRPVEALQQSYLRTKAPDLAAYLRVAEFKANATNNTLFADSRGAIAMLMPQFMPLRDDRFDYRRPVDGANPATDWRGLHSLASLPNIINPRIGWAFNVNDWPWQGAGADSPRADRYPRYMDQAGPNWRARNAEALLSGSRGWTIERLRAAAFHPELPAFRVMIPPLVAAWRALPASDPRRTRLAEPVRLLEVWDNRWSAESPAMTLASLWGDALTHDLGEEAQATRLDIARFVAERATADQRLAALDKAVEQLNRDFGRWRVPWGEINRWQRSVAGEATPFDDARPSLPVPFASAQWGSLAAYGAQRGPGTKRYYGTRGNSFVAVVEFGPRVRAIAVHTGGQSGDPASPHFADQAELYTRGALRPVYFHADELEGHVRRRYRPGQ